MKNGGIKDYKRRTRGGHNWRNLMWLPVIRDGIAYMKSGARYAVRADGWRRLTV